MNPEQSLDMFIRVYLALFFTGVALFYTVRIIRKKRATRRDAVFPGTVLSTGWWAHMSFRFFRLAIWLVCLLRWPFPVVDHYIGYLYALQYSGLQLAGIGLLTGGFMLAVFGHIALGKDWSSGVDPQGPASLHTESLYRISRNPMFLGVKMAQLGLFLALPSLFTLLCLVAGWLAIDMQLRVEEAALRQKFGNIYDDYCRKVRRWL